MEKISYKQAYLMKLDAHGRNKIAKKIDINTDIFDSRWPEEHIPEWEAGHMVELSHMNPLRNICAEYLFLESMRLRQKLEQASAPYGGMVRDEEFALEGFAQAAKDVLIVRDFIQDQQTLRESMEQRMRGKELEFNFDELVDDLNRDVEHLRLDPSAFFLLDTHLRDKAVAYNVMNVIRKGPSFGGDHPKVLGYRKATARYKDLYQQLIAVGATPDVSTVPFQQLRLATKKSLKKVKHFIIFN